jgi:hypothetical protein
MDHRPDVAAKVEARFVAGDKREIGRAKVVDVGGFEDAGGGEGDGSTSRGVAIGGQNGGGGGGPGGGGGGGKGGSRRSRSFGGSGAPSGKKDKGVKNAKRFKEKEPPAAMGF